MHKRTLLSLSLFLILFISIVISTATAIGNSTINGGFWSPVENAANTRFLDIERGDDDIIHLIGFSSCCPIEIEYTQRDLAGNWSNTVPVDSISSSRPWEGELAVSTNGTVHAIWADKESGATHKVKYSQRPPGGNWTSPTTLSDPAHDAAGLSLLINDNNQLYASWYSFGTTGLYTRYQTGGNWSSIQRVDNNQGPTQPVMLIDDQQNIHYFWFHADILNPQTSGVFYRKLAANNSWGNVTPISDPPASPGISANLFASIDGQNLHAVWGFQEGSFQNIYFAEFTNGSWNNPQKLNTTNGSYFPVFIGASNNNVYIINGDNTSGNYTYRFRPSGGSWTSEPMAFMGAYPKVLGHVSSNDNTLHLVFDTLSDPIQYRTRQNLNPWSPIETVGTSFGDGERVIKQRGINLDMAWEDNGNSSNYSHGLILPTNLPPQSYIPAVLK